MTGPVEMSCTNRIVVGIQQFTNQKVEHARINESDRPKRTRFKGDNLVIYKPTIVESRRKARGVQVDQIT